MTSEYWTILIPLAINILTVAFLFGGVIQRIRALEKDLAKLLENDLAKLHLELEKAKDALARSDSNLHRVEVVLTRIEARFDMFLGAVTESAKCPVLKEHATKMGSSQHKP